MILQVGIVLNVSEFFLVRIFRWNGSSLGPMKFRRLKNCTDFIRHWTSFIFHTYRVCPKKLWCFYFNSISLFKNKVLTKNISISEVNWNFPRNKISQIWKFYDALPPLTDRAATYANHGRRQLCRPILDDRDVLAVAPRGGQIRFFGGFFFWGFGSCTGKNH